MFSLYSRRLDNTIWWYWFFIFVIFVPTMIFYRGWAPAAYTAKYTYVESTPPGTLVSERGDFRFIAQILNVLLWLIPLTAAFMLSKPGENSIQIFRLVLLILLLIWFIIVFGFGAGDWANANDTSDPSNFSNPANDYRWCCVHFNLPGSGCTNQGTDANDGACVPGVGVGDLSTNGDFLYGFWFNVLLILLTIFDLAYMMLVFRPEVLRYGIQLKEKQNQSNLGRRYYK